MTHEEIKVLISAYTDGEVTPSEKDIVEEHLRTCESCQKDYKMYTAMSSSLSKWSSETLSPDEEINVQKSFEQRREPMFTKRTLMTLGTTLALTIIIGSVVQVQLKKGQIQGRFRSSADEIGDQYSDTTVDRLKAMYPASEASSYLAQPAMMNKKSYQNTSFPMPAGGNMLRMGMANLGTESTAYENAMPAMQQQMISDKLATTANYPTYAKEVPNNEHKIIKNAQITLKVQDAQKAQASLDALVTKYNGMIINFQISKIGDGSRSGLLVFNVLPKHLKDVLGELRKLGEVQFENQSGVDVTDQYEYLQSRLENYETDRDRLQKILVKNVNNMDSNLYIGSEIANVNANINAIAASIRNFDDQSYMATVVVNFFDTGKTTVKTISFKDRLIGSFKDSFRSTLQTACEIGINSFSGIFIVLSFLFQVLLWSLLFWGLYLIVNRFFKK